MLPTQLLCVLRAEVQLIIAHGQIVYMLKSESVVIIRKSNTRLTRDLPPEVRYVGTDWKVFQHLYSQTYVKLMQASVSGK